jgi:large subunit ribosomal protein L23
MSSSRTKHLLSDPYSVLRRPILTEKSHDMISAGAGDDDSAKGKARYTFEVHPKANKHQIKKAIEAAFGVQVEAVNTIIVKPRHKAFRGAMSRAGFTRQRKKAIIRLKKESKLIELI